MSHAASLNLIVCVGLSVGPKTPISDLKAKKVLPSDKALADGTVSGLRLEPGTAKGHGKWVLRFVSPVTNKRRDMGLGTYPEIGIADARMRGLEARRMIANGQDPIEARQAFAAARKAISEAMTFQRAAETFHKEQKPGWKNPKHADQWINTLRTYIFPKLGKKNVAELTPRDFADALRPIWLEKAETASRVKQRCHAVMKWCLVQELAKGNPVDGIDHLLPTQQSKRVRVQHQPSLPWRDLPAFVNGVLRSQPPNVTRHLMEFVILTAARSGEARAMTWAEVDLETKVWTVPASRMKAKVAHRVPLSHRAVEILKTQPAKHSDVDLVFPSPRGKVLSDMVLTGFLRDQKVASDVPKRVATAHGFRSSFRNWASEHSYGRDLAERALAHTIQNQTEAAYHHTDLLDQRRDMMEAWSNFVGGGTTSAKVVPLGRTKQH